MPLTCTRTPFGGTIPCAAGVCALLLTTMRRGHDAVGQHGLLAGHVGEERLQRLDPLGDAALDDVPLVGVDDARHQVEREGPLLPERLKVMPWSRKALASAALRVSRSSEVRRAREACSGRTCSCGCPAAVKTSSQAPSTR
jgi:hypothetical protein